MYHFELVHFSTIERVCLQERDSVHTRTRLSTVQYANEHCLQERDSVLTRTRLSAYTIAAVRFNTLTNTAYKNATQWSANTNA